MQKKLVTFKRIVVPTAIISTSSSNKAIQLPSHTVCLRSETSSARQATFTNGSDLISEFRNVILVRHSSRVRNYFYPGATLGLFLYDSRQKSLARNIQNFKNCDSYQLFMFTDHNLYIILNTILLYG